MKKGKFADWKLSDWCIYFTFILICFALFWGAWHYITTGRYLYGFLLGICFVLLLFLCLIPIFSKQAPEKKNEFAPFTVSPPKTKKGFLELAESIGANDEILAELSECLNAPKNFLKKMEKSVKEAKGSKDEELYEDLNTEYEDYAKNVKKPFIRGALILLEHRRIIARFDWKTDKETFVFFMKNLIIVKTNGLKIDKNAFAEFGESGQFCGQLDELWKEVGYHTVVIDTDSDEYVVGIRKI